MKLFHDFVRYALSTARIVTNKTGDDPQSINALSDGQLAIYEPLFRDYALSIDTRTIKPGELFWALNGAAVDGNIFIAAALEKGACGAVISDEVWHKDRTFFKRTPETFFIIVPDTFKALVDAATWWRNRFSIPLVGITGSIGKTTTKEMVRSIVEASGKSIFVTQSSYNSLVGLSLAVFSLADHHEAAVFEMGINDIGEMDSLVDFVRPTMGLITCVAHSHLKGLGSIDGVAQEKMKIFKYFTATNVGIVFGDQPILSDAHYTYPTVKFGLKTKNHVQARKVHQQTDVQGNAVTSFILKIYDQKYPIVLNTPHTALVNNAVAAAAIVHFLGISHDAIVRGLQAFKPFKNRYEQKNITGNRGVMMSDCYNASPESMRAALKTFHALRSDLPKIAVLGDMGELGDKELFWHRQVGRVLTKAQSVQRLILVGRRARAIAETAPMSMQREYVDTWQEAQAALERLLAEHQGLVLVKASKSMGLQNLVEKMT